MSRKNQPYTVIGLAGRVIYHGFDKNWYETGVIEGVVRGAQDARVNLIHFYEHLTDDPKQCVPVFKDLCDGLLHIGYDLTEECQQAIVDAGIPIVAMGGPGPIPGLPYADIDDNAAARELTEHLIGLGHRRIAMLASTPCPVSDARVAGFLQAHADASIPVLGPIREGSHSRSSGVAGAMELFGLPNDERPTAVVCFNDMVALGVMAAAAQKGLSIPDDLSVVGIDDIIDAKLARPGLTTIRQPLREIGEKSVELLLAVLDGTMAPDQRLLLPHEFVARGSTAPPRS